jgi:protein gp37
MGREGGNHVSTKTAIQWTDATWNPFVGCSRVSAGCKNCYAFQVHDMRHKAWKSGKKLPIQYAQPFTTLQFFTARFTEPLRWKAPRRIFVNSMSDLFHESVPFEFIEKIWSTMAICPQHTFQILTKRPRRMLDFFEWMKEGMRAAGLDEWWKGAYALPNVHLGVSVEDQRAADERIPLLLQVPAAARFLSCEPLLGLVDLRKFLITSRFKENYDALVRQCGGEDRIPENLRWNGVLPPALHWVIAGGESGPSARPMHPDWARSLRDQCQAAGVPFFFKQWGEWVGSDHPVAIAHPVEHNKMVKAGKVHVWPCTKPPGEPFFGMNFNLKVGKKKAGRLLDGIEWNEFPQPIPGGIPATHGG